MKVTEYQMQGTRSNSFFSFVFLVIDMEVTKTATSFFTFQGTYLHSDSFVCRYGTQCGPGP